VTFQVAATLSRVAEAEWLRTAEGLRRFCPLIGQLGEWKAFCEGGWTGPVPGDLPDVDQMPGPPREMRDAVLSAKEFGWSIVTPSKVPFLLNFVDIKACLLPHRDPCLFQGLQRPCR